MILEHEMNETTLYNIDTEIVYCTISGAGYAAVVLNIIAVIYFSAIMAYPVLYMYHSFSSPLPWQSCGNSWNTEKCTEVVMLNLDFKVRKI